MAERKIDIIIVRGCPASGKSQTAKELCKYFPKGVKLEIDNLRKMVISVDWKNQQEHINMLQLSTGLVNDFLKLEFCPVIIVDTFSGDKINKYLDKLYQLNAAFLIKIFGLYTNEDELKKRLDMRSNEEFRDFSICKKLNEDVMKIKNDTEFQIDTTGLLAKHTAEIIYEQIINETFASR